MKVALYRVLIACMWTIITEGVIGTCMSLAFNLDIASVFFAIVAITLGALPLVVINKLMCQFGWDVDML
jgi:hypothetical protein